VGGPQANSIYLYERSPSMASTMVEATADVGTLYVPFASACCTAATLSQRTSISPADCEIPVPAVLNVARSTACTELSAGFPFDEPPGWLLAGLALAIEFSVLISFRITTVSLLTGYIGTTIFPYTALK